MKNDRMAVKNAIARHKQDGCPWQINYTLPYRAMFEEANPGVDLDAALQNSIVYYRYKKNVPVSATQEVDLFGMVWDKSGEDGGDIGVPAGVVLKESSLKGYDFPGPNLDFAREQAQKLADDTTGRYRLYGLTFTLYERAWGLRGMEDLLMDMISEPAFVHELMEKITRHHLELLDSVLDYDFDAVFFADDWGSQRGLIFGEALWKEFVKPYMRQLCDKVKGHGKKVILHSCGDNSAILRQVIEIGVDCYNTVQPELYDLKKLAEEYGRDLSFYGGISNQAFLPVATPEEVEAKCLETMEILGKYNGYILSPTHHATPDIPIENLFAMVKAAERFMGME